jgi:hypothetical protein
LTLLKTLVFQIAKGKNKGYSKVRVMLAKFVFVSLFFHFALSAFTIEQEILRLGVGTCKDSTFILTPKTKFNSYETQKSFNLINVDCSARFAKYHRLSDLQSKIKGRSPTFKDRLAYHGISIIKNYDEGTITLRKIMGENWKLYLEGSKDTMDRSDIYNAQGGIEVRW